MRRPESSAPPWRDPATSDEPIEAPPSKRNRERFPAFLEPLAIFRQWMTKTPAGHDDCRIRWNQVAPILTAAVNVQLEHDIERADDWCSAGAAISLSARIGSLSRLRTKVETFAHYPDAPTAVLLRAVADAHLRYCDALDRALVIMRRRGRDMADGLPSDVWGRPL